MASDDEALTRLKKSIVPRAAMMVRWRQPFVDWANSLRSDGPRAKLSDDWTTYLIHEDDAGLAPIANVKLFWPCVFEAALMGGSHRSSDWPKERTFEMFMAWFEVEYSQDVFDLEAAKTRRV